MMDRVVFMGSPDFAVPVLRQLSACFDVIGVVTQPDRPAGRGRVCTPPPIKVIADELQLPVIQPGKLSEPEAFSQLEEWRPDLIVVAAFGQILRQAVLDLPRYGCINVHASLLPRWRGAAPIQAAILSGESSTGVTIMLMNAGVDTGPILSQESIAISNHATAGSLSTELSELGTALLIETLPRYLEGRLIPTAQVNDQATYAPMIKKEEGLLDFSKPAIELERKIRGFNPWPGAFTYFNGQTLKIHLAHSFAEDDGVPGTRMMKDGLPAINTSEGILVLDELQLAGRKTQPGKTFLQGIRDWESG